MKRSMSRVAAGLLSLGGVCVAQQPPGGITPDMINTTLPEEGAPKAEVGAYEVSIEPGTASLRTFRPTSLDKFPKSDTLPVVIWGNGGCAVDKTKYKRVLSTIASHGFLVVTTAGPPPQEGAPRKQATAADLTAAVDWVEAENKRYGSPLKGKIETRKIAVMGQSCGGALALTLGGDPRVGTIGVFSSGMQVGGGTPSASATFPGAEALKKLHGPVLLINGHERDFMMARSKATYDAIDNEPAFYGARHGAGHTATVYHPGGGEYANVASNWVLYVFKGDKKAGAMFVGKKCGLCTNSNWDTASKRLK